MSKVTTMNVRCPKCGKEFEVSVPVTEVPNKQVLHEATYQASPEATKIWETRKRQIELE